MIRASAMATMHRREMNRTEEAYSRYLQDRLMAGEIRWWAYEAWKFRLADNTHYTPDFIVVGNDLRIEAHEVKAQWSTGKPGWMEDARIKIKVAAEMHPVRFIAVSRGRDGNWEFEDFGKAHELAPPPNGAYFVKLVEIEDEFHRMKFDTEADAQRAMDLIRFACGLEGR
jgi:hypothetical protein